VGQRLQRPEAPGGELGRGYLADGKKVASLAATGNPGKENWGWHIVSRVELSAGNHILMVKKQASTPAPALLDAFYLTPDPSDRPSQ